MKIKNNIWFWNWLVMTIAFWLMFFAHKSVEEKNEILHKQIHSLVEEINKSR
jgi:hypothetical protein